MNISGNTILITGGGSGIGLALAEALQKKGNTLIVAGRSKEKLEAAAKLGLRGYLVDMRDGKSIRTLADEVLKDFPALNVVIHNAGIMKNENLIKGNHGGVSQETIEANLLGPIYLSDALLPHFLAQKSASIITVTSGLAFAPFNMAPSYSASKAAIHSYTQSLRYQLKDTSVEVKELIPPYVRTHLMGDRQAKDPNAMPLQDFIAEIIKIMEEDPNAKEIVVERVKAQRFSGSSGETAYEAFFTQSNDRMSAARRSEF